MNIPQWLPIALLCAASVLAIAAFLIFYTRIRSLSRELYSAQKQIDAINAASAAERQHLEELLSVQASEHEQLSEKLEQARKFRHDFRHQIVVLKEFVQTGDREALAASLPELTDVDFDDPLTLCDNVLVDSLAKHYFRRADDAGIELDIVLSVDRDFWVSPLDIGVLFGNLFENVVSAAKEAPEGERMIRIRSQNLPDSFVITIGNTFSGYLKRENDQFLSTKPEHAGVGLSSIKTCAAKYGGYAEFFDDGKLFRSSVILFRP